jgi:hypothetical protein
MDPLPARRTPVPGLELPCLKILLEVSNRSMDRLPVYVDQRLDWYRSFSRRVVTTGCAGPFGTGTPYFILAR